MINNKLFERNRYTNDSFINELMKVTVLEDTLNLNDIEIYLNEEVKDREYLKEVFSNIEYIDNYVQDYCEENLKKGKLGFKAYAVELSWIDIERDKVTIRYWGQYVNVELEVIYVKLNNEWMVEDIYYC